MQTILIILGIYLLYKFMVDFVIPIYQTSKRVQQQFRDINQRAKENSQPNQHNFNSTPRNNPTYQKANSTSKDYIDFEEVKD